jgi:GH24 family phage-related lysozyme (muramidase)
MVARKDDIPSYNQSKEIPGHFTGDTADKKFYGLYIGVVKGTRDSQHMGRLEVYLPDMGGDEDNYRLWKTVSYATPFGGSTPAAERHWIHGKTYDFTPTAYGFWAVPPDVGNKVLVMFIDGDTSRGVWIGCLLDSFMNHSMPGLGVYDKHDAPCYPIVPTTEYNKYDPALNDPLMPPLRPYHRPTYDRLVAQGLIEDPYRGTTSSSAARETPSHVYGMSTPGPIDPDAERVGETFKRAGGHTFVMDDGDPMDDNKNGLIRLRTRGGAQILLHDSSGFVYICNKDATAWIELDQVGNVEIYSGQHLSIRAEEDINIRADRDLNIDIGRDLNLHMPADYAPPLGISTNDLGQTYDPAKASDPIKTPIADGSIIYELKNGHIHGTLDKGDIETDIAGYVRHLIHKTLHYHVIDNMSYHTAAKAFFTSNDEMNVKAGGIYKETAPEIHMNGPEAVTDIFPAAPILPELIIVDDVLTYVECVGPEILPHEGRHTRLPSREPYQYHKNELTRGLYPQAAADTVENKFIDPVDNRPIKDGAITSRDTKPLDKIDITGIFEGVGFGPEDEPIFKKKSEPVNAAGESILHDMNIAKVSERGVDIVKDFEGYSATPYKDSAGKLTIGYGHLIKPGESFTTIDKAKAKELLAQDMKEAERAVKRAITKPLTQNQFDALTSMAYNIGINAFRKSTLVKEINAGNIEKAPSEMMKWSKVTKNIEKTVNGRTVSVPTKVINKGLLNRRTREAKLFTTPPSRSVVIVAEADEESAITLLG